MREKNYLSWVKEEITGNLGDKRWLHKEVTTDLILESWGKYWQAEMWYCHSK